MNELSSTDKLEGLQALRFIAAFLVLLAHVKYASSTTTWAWMQSAAGAVGVDIFFVISGFVISLSAAKMDRNYRRFFAHRMARVVPLYLFFSGYLVLRELYLRGSISSFPRLWNSLFYVPLFDHGGFSGTYHDYGWTLSFEMWFYAAFGLLIGLAGARRATLLLPASLSAGALLSLLLYHGNWYLPRFLFHPMVLEFSAGCLLYRYRARITPAAGLGFLLLLPVLGTGVLITDHLGRHMEVLVSPALGFQRALLWGSFAVCVVGSVIHLDRNRGGGFPRWMVLLGDASYSIYLVQPFALRLVNRLFPEGGLGAGIVFIVLTVTGGLVSWKILEKTFNRHARPALEKWLHA